MLSVKNLTKIYKTKGGNDTKALDNVTLDFPETGMIFLLGKSGSGKSTLLNLIGGLDYPTSGEIILKGRSSKDFSQSDFDSYRNTYIGFVFQEYNILNEFSVEQNIGLAIELQNKKVNKEDVDSLLAQVELQEYAKRKPNTLSGGQKQRIAIARALIKQPNIIMADEPTGALDSKTGEQVFETMKKLSKDKLVIVVSHDRDFAERFGDRIIELKDGKVISDETKHLKEAKAISENVSIINDHAIKINDAKKLTKGDFDKLYEAIKGSDGKVFISSGENADKSMKVARIGDDGSSDEFKDTGKVSVQEYDASKTKFIKSRMPMGKAIKMGLSSLKTKPIRLVFTMLLSVVSFSMFGIASGLMLYNSSHTYSEALRRTDYLSEALGKNSIGYQVSQEIDSNGKVVRENKYDNEQEVLFGESEIDELNKNNHNLVYVGVGELTDNFPFTGLTMTKNSEFYSKYYKLKYVSDEGKEIVDKLGYQVVGNYPTADDEIMLPKSFGEMLIDSGAMVRDNYTKLVGSTLNMSVSKGTRKVKISGFYDAGDIPSTYDELKKENSSLTQKELEKLQKDLPSFFEGSFNSVVFSTSKFFDENARNNSSSNWIQQYYRNGIRIESNPYVKDEDVSQDMGNGFYTDEIYNKNKGSFTLYDLEGNVLSSLSLKDDEIMIDKSAFFSVAFDMKRGFYQDFLNMDLNMYRMKLMPTYKAYYSEHIDDITNLKNNLWSGDFTEIDSLFNTYKAEYEKAYKIENITGDYRSTTNYSNLSSSDKALFDKVYNYDQEVVPTASEINSVYDILVENFDKADAQKNYLAKKYLENMFYTDKGNVLINNTPEILDIYNKIGDFRNWTSSEVSTLKAFLEENYDSIMFDGKSYNSWSSMMSGYTFAEYKVPNPKVLQANTNITYYYKSYNGQSGDLKVVGYYDIGDFGGSPIVTKTFIDSVSVAESRGGNTYIYYYQTDYVAPDDARYLRAMVKSSFSFEQVEFMRKSNNKTFEYTLTSARYQSAYMVVSLIVLLKNIFLWVGVGFGVFAALMLLNFITTSISSKKREIGILRAIGARKIDVFKIFFSESLFIAAICALLSIIITLVTQFFLDRYFVSQIDISVLQFNPLTLIFIIAIAAVISFIATIIPVLHSSRKPPVESIRSL